MVNFCFVYTINIRLGRKTALRHDHSKTSTYGLGCILDDTRLLYCSLAAAHHRPTRDLKAATDVKV